MTFFVGSGCRIGLIVEGTTNSSTTEGAIERAQTRVQEARRAYDAAISDLAEARLRAARVVAEQMAADRACAIAQSLRA